MMRCDGAIDGKIKRPARNYKQEKLNCDLVLLQTRATLSRWQHGSSHDDDGGWAMMTRWQRAGDGGRVIMRSQQLRMH